MQNQQWQHVSDLFAAALECDDAERDEWIRSACAGDIELEREIHSLLAAYHHSGVLDRKLDVTGSLTETTVVDWTFDEKVGPYRIVEQLGGGGMGVVFKAHDDRLQRFVALKFLARSLADSPRAKQQMMTEARAASALDHPNICAIYDIGETEDGRIYLAMAYCEGETLAARLCRERLPVEKAVAVAVAICRGLSCAHEAGIVHRDIKPSNIILTTRGDVKIVDFGIAKLGRDSDAFPGRAGTVFYSAPEQMRGADVDGRADIWSAGVVLYEMLTGEKPFPGDNEATIIDAVLHREPKPAASLRPGIPPQLDAAIRRALAKDPAERFARINDFADALTKAPTGESTKLPAPTNSFIGRELELVRATALIRSARLVTLTGPAGTGKTRLAMELARELARTAEVRDGARFVGLSAITDPELVLPAIAEALHLFTSDARRVADDVIAALRDRQMLLVLDNFEQVTAAALVVAGLLQAVPGLKIVVTSRVPLRLTGEHEMPVPPLRTPPPSPNVEAILDTPAVQLFIDRATAARPDLPVTEEHLPAIAELCRRLDGLPLAIELAAARAKVLSPQAIVSRLGSRLDLLKGGARDRPARHQTLRQALAWSYDLLTDDERTVFRRAGVFVGGFTLEAIDAVCRAFGDTEYDTLDLVSALVDHSLVVQHESADGEPRFYLLETMREYALELLTRSREEEAVRSAHADWFVEMSRRAEVALPGAGQAVWLRRLDANHDNIRAALEYLSARRDCKRAIEIANGVWRFWTARGHHLEGRRWFRRLLDGPCDGLSDRIRANALNACATLAHGSCDLEEADRDLKQALELYRQSGDTHGAALVLNNLSWMAIELGELGRAAKLAEEAQRLHTEAKDERGIGVALNNLGWIANYKCEFDSAVALHTRSVEHRRRAGDERGVAYGLTNLSWTEQRRCRYDRASAHVNEACTVLDDIRDELLCSWAWQMRGAIAYDNGDYGYAVEQIEKAMPAWYRVGNVSGMLFGVLYLSLAYLKLGDPDRAEATLNAAEAASVSMPQKWGLALLVVARCRLLHARGERAEAIERCEEAARDLGALHDWRGLAEAHELLAELLVATDPDRARRSLELADEWRQRIGAPPPPCDRPAIARVREALSL